MTERERLVRLIDQSPAHFCNGCNESPEERAESIEKLADHLLAEDYRKASDVVQEIFSEIETFIIDQCFLTDAGVAKIYKKLVEVRNSYKDKGT